MCGHLFCMQINVNIWNNPKDGGIIKGRGQETLRGSKQHMDWITTDNFWTSHFGFQLDELQRDSLLFDMFHLRCSMSYL